MPSLHDMLPPAEAIEQQLGNFAQFSLSLYDSIDSNIADALEAMMEDLTLFDPRIPLLGQAVERLRRADGPALPPPPPL